jgi:serine phosphatase RsbU (regulator of sigma subunit)
MPIVETEYDITKMQSAVAGARFVEELRRIVTPIANCLNVAVAYTSNQITEWIVSDQDLALNRLSGLDGARPYPVADSYREWEEIPVSYDSVHIGDVFVEFDADQLCAKTSIERVIESAMGLVALQKEEESLLEELSASWESLEAVYEISSDLRAMESPGELLDRILSRAVATGDELHAALWIEQDEILLPTAMRNVSGLTPKDISDGLLAKTIAGRKAVIINDQSRIDAYIQSDPELLAATSVALAPIVSSQGLRGVLELWDENGRHKFDSHTIGLIQALALQAAMVIENDRLHRASIESERLKQEVEIGSRIQYTLLLGQPPEHVSGLEIAALTLPSRQVNGDFYDFIKHADDCVDVIIGDVMGKGVPAALLGAATKSQLLRALNTLLTTSTDREIPEPERIITRLHEALTAQLIQFESFTTLCLARFDTSRKQLRFVDCGHTRGIHFRKQDGACGFLQGENVPLGFSEREAYKQQVTSFEAGDVFLFYSDGLTEARSCESGEMFGEDLLASFLQANNLLDPSEFIQVLRRELVAFSGSDTFADDLSCIAIKATARRAPEHA